MTEKPAPHFGSLACVMLVGELAGRHVVHEQLPAGPQGGNRRVEPFPLPALGIGEDQVEAAGPAGDFQDVTGDEPDRGPASGTARRAPRSHDIANPARSARSAASRTGSGNTADIRYSFAPLAAYAECVRQDLSGDNDLSGAARRQGALARRSRADGTGETPGSTHGPLAAREGAESPVQQPAPTGAGDGGTRRCGYRPSGAAR